LKDLSLNQGTVLLLRVTWAPNTVPPLLILIDEHVLIEALFTVHLVTTRQLSQILRLSTDLTGVFLCCLLPILFSVEDDFNLVSELAQSFFNLGRYHFILRE